jgi:NAD(P)-dependent dehydrogenase (short-subunit alcohol dehydrogenase family)
MRFFRIETVPQHVPPSFAASDRQEADEARRITGHTLCADGGTRL